MNVLKSFRLSMASRDALRPGRAAELFIRLHMHDSVETRTYVFRRCERCAVTEHDAFAEERVSRQVILCAKVNLVHALLQGLRIQ